jgi:hypothetical protein
MISSLHTRIKRPSTLGLGLLVAPLLTLLGTQTVAAQTYTGNAIGTGTISTCSVSGSTASLAGTGSSLSDKAASDNYGLCSTTVSTNFMLTARVTALGSSTSIGIELRDGTAANARNEAIYVQPSGSVVSVSTDRREFSGTYNIATQRPVPVYPESETSYPGPTLPFWLRLIRYNDEISLEYSPDSDNYAYEWRAATENQSLTGLASSLNVGFFISGSGATATLDNVTLTSITAPPTQPATTWLGNTFPGGGAFMQHRGQAMTVDNNGYLYIQGQGEAQSLISLTAATGVFQTYFSHSHYTGAPGIASSCGYVWSPLYLNTGSNPSLQPGLQYYNTSGQVSSQNPFDEFDAGLTVSGVTQPSIDFYSVAADPSACTLYALEYNNNVLHTINTSTATISDTGTPSPPTDSPKTITLATTDGGLVQYIALDPTGKYLWGVEDSGTSHHVEKFSVTDGSNQGIVITGLNDPRGIATDTAGYVYITDHAPSDQRVRVFTSTGSFAYTLGLTGGSYSESTPGTIAPTSFDHPEGIAIDKSNNLYVSSSGPDSDNGFGNTGQSLRMYKPNTEGGTVTSIGASNLVWHTEGLEYQDGVSADPSSLTDIYDKTHHYTVNYSHLTDGDNSAFWTYKGTTVNDQVYTQDPRNLDSYDAGTQVRNINGGKYLLVADQSGTMINIYRFLSNSGTPSEIVAPYARFNRRTASTNNFELWQDAGSLNGEPDSNSGCTTSGTNTTEETCTYPSPMISVYQDNFYWYMDIKGNVWSVGSLNNAAPIIYEFLAQGTGTTAPTWCYLASPPNKCVVTYSVPQAFAYASGTYDKIMPLRLLYDEANDAMYIGGYTDNSNVMHYNTFTEEKDEGSTPEDDSGAVGSQILRYNNWSTYSGTKSASLVADCTITIDAPPTPPDTGAGQSLGNEPRAFDVAHGLVVVENDFTNRLTYYYAYDPNCSKTQTAKVYPQYLVGTNSPGNNNNYGNVPGPEVGSVSGTIDSGQTVNLTYLNDGKTYVTTTEESGQHKIIVTTRTDSAVPQP